MDFSFGWLLDIYDKTNQNKQLPEHRATELEGELRLLLETVSSEIIKLLKKPTSVELTASSKRWDY